MAKQRFRKLLRLRRCGETRRRNDGTQSAGIQAWGGKDEGHFLIVKIDVANDEMEIIPYTENSADGNLVKLPVFSDISRRRRLTSDIRIFRGSDVATARCRKTSVKTYWTETGEGADPDPGWDTVGGNNANLAYRGAFKDRRSSG